MIPSKIGIYPGLFQNNEKYDFVLVIDDVNFFVMYPKSATTKYIFICTENFVPSILFKNLVNIDVVHLHSSKILAYSDTLCKKPILSIIWDTPHYLNFSRILPPNYPYDVSYGESQYTDKTLIINGSRLTRVPTDGDIFITTTLSDKTTSDLPFNGIGWNISTPYSEILSTSHHKTDIISAIIPRDTTILKYLDERMKINTFGNGGESFKNYQGEIVEKDSGLFPYKYHIAFEDCQENGYFTERLCDSILSGCLTFYRGCPDIDKYIDSGAYILLPDTPEECLKVIQESISDNEYEKRFQFIEIAKRQVLNLSIFNAILPMI